MPAKKANHINAASRLNWNLMAPVLGALCLAGAWVIFTLVNRPDKCSAELSVNGRTLDFKGALKELKLESTVSPAAIKDISDRLQFQMSESARLCRDADTGLISKEDYLTRRDQLANWYMSVSKVAESGNIKEDGEGIEELLDEASEPQSLASVPHQLANVVLKNSDGAILPSGATVHTGDRLKLEVSVSKPVFLYVLGVGSSGAAYRLFPSPISSFSNPVQGELSLPQRNDKFLIVGGEVGQEKLHIYVSNVRDRKMESLAAIGSGKGANKETANLKAAVKRTLVVRDLFAESGAQQVDAPTQMAKPKPISLESRFGRAATTIALNHVP